MKISMNIKERWIELLVSLIITALFGSGSAYLLRLFEERLPEWLFTAFLIVLCVVFIAILIRFVFEDWIQKLIRYVKNKKEKRATYNLAVEWRKKFMDLWELIREVIDKDWQPTKKQWDKYFGLHFWFTNTRPKFIPMWRRFSAYRPEEAHEHYDSTTALGYIVFKENYTDPFSYFYEPLQIEDLGDILRSRQKGEIDRVLIKLVDQMYEFCRWIKLQ